MKKLIHALLFPVIVIFAAVAAAQPPAPPSASDLPPEIQALLANRAPDTSTWAHFDTEKEAALYGAARLEKCSHAYECNGNIFKDQAGKFVMGPVHTDYASDHVHVSHGTPPGFVAVANIHSHPCLPGYYTGLFSPQDLMGSILFRRESYMVDLCTGDVHRFIPGKDKPDAVNPDDDVGPYMTGGTVIGTVAAFPTEQTAKEGI